MLKQIFNVQSPVFRPLWLRAAIVAFVGGWAILELSGGNYGWAALFVATAAYLAYEFFVVFDPDKGDDT